MLTEEEKHKRKLESDCRYRKANSEKRKLNTQLWRVKNRIRYNAYAVRANKEYRKKHPEKYFFWRKLSRIQERCRNPNRATFKVYGAKGTRCFLTVDQLKFLWFRDGADKMKKPSIHRLDSSKHYSIDNCQYLEWAIHAKIKD